MKLKIFTSIFLLTVLLLSSPSYLLAQTVSTTSTSTQVQSLLDQIKVLMTQIETLKAAQTQLQNAQSSVAQTLTLMRSLRQGMSGDDVKALQAILASDPTIYPEGIVSGYYGKLTSEAVKKFQKKNGIEALGFVGPKTLEKLNKEVKNLNLSYEEDEDDEDEDNDKKEKKVCVAYGHLIAPGWAKKNERPSVTTCTSLPYGIAKKIASTTPPTATTTPDIIAPVVSGLTATTTTATTTNIIWSTNELAKGVVYYSSTNPMIVSSTTSMVKSDVYQLNQNILINNLASSTIYYYVITTTDVAGNTSTSTQNSLTTLSI